MPVSSTNPRPDVEIATQADQVAEGGSATVSLLGETYGASPDGILERYLADGMAGLTSLEGSFVIVVDDRACGNTWVMTDHVGSRTAYIWELGERTLVTNTLAAGPRRELTIDPGGVCSYLANDGVRAGLTPYREVRSMPPGSIADLRSDGGPENYWRVPMAPQSGSIDELAPEMIHLMRRAVRKRLGAFNPGDVLLSLSGGVDSKGLLGLLTEEVGPDTIEAVTYFHGEQVGDMDLPEARLAAATAGVRHRPIAGYQGDFLGTLVDNAVRGDSVAHFCDDANVWRSLGAEAVDGRVVVAGDRQAHHLGLLPDDMPVDALLRLVSFGASGAVDWFLASLPGEAGRVMADEWEERFESVLDEYRVVGNWRDAVHAAYLEQRATPTLSLWRERFSRQAGAVVNPFLDRDLLEFVGHLPRRLNDVGGEFLHRIALERAFPALFERGSAHGGWNVPDWGTEVARHADGVRRLISAVDSPLEALVPKEITLALIDAVVSGGPKLSAATSGWRWAVRRAIKKSAALTDIVRDRKLRRRIAGPVKVGKPALLRRLLTLHLALADHAEVEGLLNEE